MESLRGKEKNQLFAHDTNAVYHTEYKKQLEQYIEHSSTAKAMFDTDMRFLVVSSRWISDYKLGGQEIKGKSFYEIFPQTSSKWKAIHQNCLNGNVEAKDEDCIIRNDGSVTWVRWEIHPWQKETGEIGGIIIFTEDITERKIAAQLIAQSEEKYRTLVERISDGFIALDTDWKFTYANKVAGILFQKPVSELIGKNIWELFPATVDKTFFKAYHEAMRTQQNMHVEDYSAAIQSWVQAGIYPSPTGVSVYFRDLTEQRKAEAEAKKNEERYKTLVERISDGFIALDANWNFVYANKVSERMFGRAAEYLIGKNIWEVFPEAVGNTFYNGYKLAMDTQERVEFVDFSPYAQMWLRTKVYPSPSGLTIYFNDITEQKNSEEKAKQKEKAARHSNETRKLIMQSALDAIVCIDMSLNITLWNMQAEKLLGWKQSEALGKNIVDTIIPLRYRDRYIKGFSKYLATGEDPVLNKLVEIKVLNKSEKELQVEVFIVPVSEEDEEPFLCAFIRDISERKKAEAEILQTQMRLNQAQALAHIGNWEISYSTQTSKWSDEAYRIFGLEPKATALSEEAWLSFVHPADKHKVKKEIEKGRNSLQGFAFNHRIITASGSIKYVYTESKYEFDDNGMPIALYGIIKDITEQKQAEAEREQILRDIIRHNKDLEQFAYIVSHNLRLPVANIIGFAEILKNDALDDNEKKEFTTALLSSVQKLDEIVADLNHVLQVRREINEKREKVSFTELTNSIIESIDNIVRKENVTINVDFSAIDKVNSLKGYMYSVFYNLIVNSIKYRRKEVPLLIDIKSRLTHEHLVLSFKDNGLGIDLEKYEDRLFRLYKRFHSHVEGKGMGLFMVKTQIEALGGKISVHSKVNEGTEFIIEFEQSRLTESNL
ncbi:MAG: PAS domain-containing sensor histidine kinase [Parafilimonas sp.]|nr:PAS domain-containing sensor histidine kinase [Parafilimonas sp.]